MERRHGVDRVPKIEEFPRLLVADDHWHHDCRADARETHFRLAERRIVGGDRQVAQHDEHAAAAHYVSLHRRDYRPYLEPQHHLKIALAAHMLIHPYRI